MRQHDDLFELLVVQGKQLFYFRIGIARFRRHGVIMVKGHISQKVDDFTALSRTRLGRRASDAVGLPVVFERQIDVADGFFRCKLGLESIFFPAAAAGDVIKCIGNGVENRGFARTCWPAHKKQRLVLELREVQYDFFFVWPEGTHF